ncbi:MAG: porin family protein, partial [Proteobacteria bacterium]|nr:porin family protein [Pseudomonadota bacterium]
RRVVLGLVLVGVSSLAHAGDLDEGYLRGSQPYEPGSPTYQRWSGVYVGGHAGMGYGATDFRSGVSSLIANILRNTTLENEAQVSRWATLGRASASGPSYGGFVGYNAQWENAVIGVELNYSHMGLSMTSSDTLARSYQTSDGYFYNINLNGTASVRLTDLGTLRVRGGWVFDSIMPYGFAGLAVARADVRRSATVALTATDLVAPFGPNLALNQTQSETATGVFAYGWALGTGVEWAVMQNIFLRAEYEYVRFAAFKDTRVQISTGRVGAGVKF